MAILVQKHTCPCFVLGLPHAAQAYYNTMPLFASDRHTTPRNFQLPLKNACGDLSTKAAGYVLRTTITACFSSVDQTHFAFFASSRHTTSRNSQLPLKNACGDLSTKTTGYELRTTITACFSSVDQTSFCLFCLKPSHDTLQFSTPSLKCLKCLCGDLSTKAAGYVLRITITA